MVLGNFKGQKEKKPLAYRASKLADTLSSKGAPCAVCGSYEDVQMRVTVVIILIIINIKRKNYKE